MPGNNIKDRDKYEALRDEGMSKGKAARIANSGKESSEEGGEHKKYEKWSKKELSEKAGEVGISGHSKMDKPELIDALRNH